MHFINNAEMAALASEGFSIQEIIPSEEGVVKRTTIYSGKSPSQNPIPQTEDLDNWKIMRTIIEETGNKTLITIMWAEGSWTERANLTYKYL